MGRPRPAHGNGTVAYVGTENFPHGLPISQGRLRIGREPTREAGLRHSEIRRFAHAIRAEGQTLNANNKIRVVDTEGSAAGSAGHEQACRS
jgi:hypothetical protein